jgi:hypothetical protein
VKRRIFQRLRDMGWWISTSMKKLFCGDYGMGAMADTGDIVNTIRKVTN